MRKRGTIFPRSHIHYNWARGRDHDGWLGDQGEVAIFAEPGCFEDLDKQENSKIQNKPQLKE